MGGESFSGGQGSMEIEGGETRSRGTTGGDDMLEAIMPKNEHAVERVLRVALGVVLIALVFVGPESPWGWIGLIPLVTGLVGSCPLYTLFGISTCRVKSG